MRSVIVVGACVALGLSLVAGGGAIAAQPQSGEGIPLRIVASAGGESAEAVLTVPIAWQVAQRSEWSLGEPIVLRASGKALGTVDRLQLQAGPDPAVSLIFSVIAGASSTTFTITSAVITFPGLVNPWANAVANITVTDNDNDGATFTGQLGLGHAYEARYNAGPVVWVGLLGTHNAGAGGSVTVPARWPATGWAPIAATLTSMQAAFSFTLTALDSASGTSAFTVNLPSVAATSGTPQQTRTETPFPESLEATVTDPDGAAVVGATVTFIAPVSGASGVFPAGNTAVTDGSGRASVPFAANSIGGSYQVTANITPPLATPATFELENAEPVPLLGASGLALLALLVMVLALVALRRGVS